MVEVFKTDVKDESMAQRLLDLIHFECRFYHANFDLQDCDHILRIQTEHDEICAKTIIAILQLNGCYAEVLPDA